MYVFRRAQAVSLPIAQCWSFFSNPANLSRITPPALGFRIRSELPQEIYAGLMIRYTVSPLLRVPMTWVTEITHVRKPDFFVDEQRVGPYKMWHHEHFFRAISSEATEVIDLVHYMPPLRAIGALLNVLVIRRQLTRIFDFRAEQLARMIDAPPTID